ncbi:hypothetical protein GCM10008967_01390 [Bacillus carboniphilus]|uniref:Intracellular proteinase inhibitor BsuPI domain-containing protein n=1 Tax=Bacillus carboniphilus TaxID=86663 RepID=A0ABP3FC97_9BACI
MRKAAVYFVTVLLFLGCFQSVAWAESALSKEFTLDVDLNRDPTFTEFIITLRNTSKQKQTFLFTTSQTFEIQVTNLETKETVYTYSANKSFLQALQTLQLKPDESKQWKDRWVYPDGKKPVGDHLVRVSLVAKSVNKKPLSPSERTIEKVVTYTREHPTIQNVSVEKRYEGYYITGTIQSNQNVYFSLDDGHHVFIQDKAIPVKSHNFSILVPYKEIPANTKGTIVLTIHGKGDMLPYAIDLGW